MVKIANCEVYQYGERNGFIVKLLNRGEVIEDIIGYNIIACWQRLSLISNAVGLIVW